MANKKNKLILGSIVSLFLVLGLWNINYKVKEIKIEDLNKNSNSQNSQKQEKDYSITPKDTSIYYEVSLKGQEGLVLKNVSSDKIAGNYSKEINSIKIETPEDEDYIVEYQIYENNVGWSEEYTSGQIAQKKKDENSLGALKMSLKYKEDTRVSIDELNIYYSIYTKEGGWSEYCKNGEVLGAAVEGNNNSIRAIKVFISDREEDFNSDNRRIQLLKYNDKTIDINIEKFRGYNTAYYICRINTKEGNKIKSVNTEDTLKPLSEMLKDKNAVIGINGSSFSTDGIVINKVVKDRESIDGNSTIQYTMAINEEGDIFTPYSIENPYYQNKTEMSTRGESSYTGSELIDKWNVVETFHFGPPLIVDGKKYEFQKFETPEPRTIIGQVNKNQYIILISEGRDKLNEVNGMYLEDAQKILEGYNTKFAFNLDGGGSTTLYFDGRILNKVTGGKERSIPDGIYFTKE